MNISKCTTQGTKSIIFQYRTKTKLAKGTASYKQPRLYFRFGDDHAQNFTINIQAKSGIWARDLLEAAYPAVFKCFEKSKYHLETFTEDLDIPHQPSGKAHLVKNSGHIKTWLSIDNAQQFAAELGVNLGTVWDT